ncbi:MAG: 16S rRNA (guanine(966)-N(2))-methyltransferase RsmD, partial [Erysipelotrichaceae bacterium]|nr:16S rRNA (guanine(966)-N(2))-methyltransferase RsmD [Erysipelotrichaceae bacterium]
MRITAGKHRSRVLKSLEGDNTRPTTDKVKEAVFSKLGPYFEGGSILDLFGGSGAIS